MILCICSCSELFDFFEAQILIIIAMLSTGEVYKRKLKSTNDGFKYQRWTYFLKIKKNTLFVFRQAKARLYHKPYLQVSCWIEKDKLLTQANLYTFSE